ncbi:MAG TPA: signal peptide peptidase SppA [Sphingobacteriaceae bacterium]|nr:signal peptide peptidase SppA [Sphingobacteriaceae bacterium]
MKQFFKYVLATIVGVTLSSVILFLIFFGIMAALVSSVGSEKEFIVKDNSVLKIGLAYPIDERTSNNPFEGGFNFLNINSDRLGLNDILSRIQSAKEDEKIKGIYLDMSTVPSSFATLEEIRDALIDFKASGKFILAYSEVYSQSAYYLTSTADSVFLNPEGILDFRGLASQSMFFKGTLEKLGIEAQVIKVGTYKSAVEPFILDKMSEPNRQQVSSFLGSIYDHFLQGISTSRNIPADSLRAIANELRVQNAEDAVATKLVDGLKYKDEIISDLKERLGVKEDKEINLVAIEKYNNSKAKPDASVKDRIAVIYATGEIISGEGSDSQIGSERISREIRKVREDEKVKAVVLRINSPGGSALASDVIWREVKLTKEAKPIVVSMGDVAASGGYYIACAADSIFAQPNTITGSIGVFGIIPNLEGFFNSKLGITFDEVKTGEYADLGNTTRPLTPGERSIIQQQVDQIYFTFTNKVAQGRNKERVYIDSIGQGRVWTGEQALGLGLVDRLGGIETAIKSAAKMADIEKYRLVNYPALSDPFKALLGNTSDDISAWFMKREMKDAYPFYNQAKQVMEQTGIQARIPYTITIN